MIIVYNSNTGKIIYTIEGNNQFKDKYLNEGEEFLIIKDRLDKPVKTYTHKINIETKSLIKISKEERETELAERKKIADEFKEKITAQKNNKKEELTNKIDELERRLLELEKLKE